LKNKKKEIKIGVNLYKIENIKNTILKGDTIKNLKKIPSNSIDLIFADPPYFMQTDGELLRTEGTVFKGVDDNWDKFTDYKQYDDFCEQWLIECKRILKKEGSIWVIGAFQNIYRLGYIMQNLGFWILNDVIWNKSNPVPNFKGTRFTNASETMLWCTKQKEAKYTFNYKTMKYLNGGTQMKSVWNIPLCTGVERIKNNDGKKAHATQKPEQLLLNVILSSSKINDVILDPFFGTGTTGAIAKLTGRNFIGIEREEKYIKVATKRIDLVKTKNNNPLFLNKLDIKPPRVSVTKLIEKKYLLLGEKLFSSDGKNAKLLNKEGYLIDNKDKLSIHKMAAKILNKTNHNGWDYWFVKRKSKFISINDLRKQYRKNELDFIAFEL
jgi:site-specific DNA-methyltransferase (adenine-specific)